VKPPDFDAIRTMTLAQLVEAGCRPWDDSGLVLFPASWFDLIPDGFRVRSILGHEQAFTRSLSRDQRFGFLAFGILAARQ
jgi:hypothetical protein